VSDESHTNIFTITFTQFARKVSSTLVSILKVSRCVQQSKDQYSSNSKHTCSPAAQHVCKFNLTATNMQHYTLYSCSGKPTFKSWVTWDKVLGKS